MKICFSLLRPLSIVFVSLSAAVNLHAQSPSFGVGAQLGTTGYGLTIDGQINPYLSARGSLDILYRNADVTAAVAHDPDTNFSIDINVPSASLGLNLHPFKNGARIGAGVTFANPKFEVTADYDSNLVTNNDGKIHFAIESKRTLLPYIGVGYTGRQESGWYPDFDLGLLATGGYDGIVNVDLSCGTDTVCQSEQSLVEQEAREEMKKITDDLFEFYPVVRFGVGYRF